MKYRDMKIKTVVRMSWRNGCYLTLDNAVFEDSKLSLRAKGLHAYLMSRDDNWEVHLSQLVSICKEGRDAAQKALTELRRRGYLELYEVRNHRGQVLGTEWIRYERPDSPRWIPPENLRGLFLRHVLIPPGAGEGEEQVVTTTNDDAPAQSDSDNQKPLFQLENPEPEKPDTVKPDTGPPDTADQALKKEVLVRKNECTKKVRTDGVVAGASRSRASPRRAGAPFPAELVPIAGLLTRVGFGLHDAQQLVMEFGEHRVRRYVGYVEWWRENGGRPRDGDWRGVVVAGMKRHGTEKAYRIPEGVEPAKTAEEIRAQQRKAHLEILSRSDPKAFDQAMEEDFDQLISGLSDRAWDECLAQVDPKILHLCRKAIKRQGARNVKAIRGAVALIARQARASPQSTQSNAHSASAQTSQERR